MPYVRDIAKMPQNIISPQALTTGTLLAEKEGVSDGHHTSDHTSPHRHRHMHVLLCRLLYRLRSIPVSVSVSSPIRSFNFPIPQFLSFFSIPFCISESHARHVLYVDH